jgi:hypothetical protein
MTARYGEALAAIRRFLRFQIHDQQTGDSVSCVNTLANCSVVNKRKYGRNAKSGFFTIQCRALQSGLEQARLLYAAAARIRGGGGIA